MAHRLCSPVLLLPALLLLALSASGAAAQSAEEEAAYRKAIHERATRIVEALALDEEDARDRLVQIIADQYRELRDLHELRDNAREQGPNREKVSADQVELQIVQLHRHFVARLRAELPPDQVEKVKDGMTYGVAPITYAAYLRLLPDLTDDQKRVIQANLVEAREYAMDAGTSSKKHAWFGKYKGHINNYLSAAGYDLKQAERDLAQRERATQP